MNMQQPYKIQF